MCTAAVAKRRPTAEQKTGGCSNVLFFIAADLFGKGKGKVHPTTGQEGPEGEKRYSSTLSLTSALDGGGWSTPGSGRFTARKDLVPIV